MRAGMGDLLDGFYGRLELKGCGGLKPHLLRGYGRP
jgi:hypothetical protein